MACCIRVALNFEGISNRCNEYVLPFTEYVENNVHIQAIDGEIKMKGRIVDDSLKTSFPKIRIFVRTKWMHQTRTDYKCSETE